MTSFNVDDLVCDFDEKDFAPQRDEPKENVWFEFETKSTKIKQAKAGHLQATIEVEALNADGNPMFKKWINTPLPVSMKDISPPKQSLSIFLSTMRPFFPETAAYDTKLKDPVSKKTVYMKDGQPVNGKAYESAVTEQNRSNAAIAKEMAVAFVTGDDDEVIFDGLNGRRFYAKIEKKGDYSNVKHMEINLPEGEEAVYSREEAMQ